MSLLIGAALGSGITIAWEREHDIYHFEPAMCGGNGRVGWVSYQPTPDGAIVRCETSPIPIEVTDDQSG